MAIKLTIVENHLHKIIRIGQEDHTAERDYRMALGSELMATSTLHRTLAPQQTAPTNSAPASKVLMPLALYLTLTLKATSMAVTPKEKLSKATP